MLGRVAVCGAAAAMMLPILLVSAPASAKGMGFRAGPPAAAWRGHVPLLHRHAVFSRGHIHRSQSHRNPYRDGYGYGYGYLPSGLAYGDYAPQEIVVPVAYPVPIVPRCIPSVETVIVPAELGGERKIRITRCPR